MSVSVGRAIDSVAFLALQFILVQPPKPERLILFPLAAHLVGLACKTSFKSYKYNVKVQKALEFSHNVEFL